VNFREAHRQAMDAAAEAHEEYAVDTFARVDVFAVIVEAGIDLFFRPTGDVAGAYLPAAAFGAGGIVINSDHPLALQRYSGGHELGHHWYGHGAKVDYEVELATGPDRDRLDPEEMLAEAFASWFLMPPELVELMLERVGVERPRTPRDVYQLALRLGTSYQATCYHLPSVQLLKSASAHTWAQMTLRTIKEELTSLPRPGGWRQDVWAIREGDEGQTLTVRRGDRLVFELADVEVVTLPPGATLLEGTAETLFSRTPFVEMDVALDAPPGATAIGLSHAGRPFQLGLQVERSQIGPYWSDAAPAPARRAP
jgi:hypothetical protein